MGRYKTYLTILLMFSVYMMPFNIARAGAAEKWELVENIYDSSKNVVKVTARKIGQDAANSSVYKVNVPVNASTLGASVKSMLWAGVAVGAVTSLIEGVGWIIDKGSKTIKRPKNNSELCTSCTGQYIWYPTESLTDNKKVFYSSPSKSVILNLFKAYLVSQGYKDIKIDITSSKDWGSKIEYYHTTTSSNKPKITGVLTFVRVLNSNYDPSSSIEPDYEIMSDSQLGNEILGNGETAGDTSVIPDVYSPNNPVDAPAPQESNDALNNANPQPGKEPEGKSETEKEKDENGKETGKQTSKFELPNFCTWAPAVCDFFKVQKQDNKEIKENQNKQLEQDKTFFEKVSDFFDWAKADSSSDNKIDIDQDTQSEPDSSINFSTSCPAKIPLTFNWNGGTMDFSFDFTMWCQAISTFVYPIVVALGSLHALYIVAGVRQDG
ncbi:hypothetical protein KTH71_09480 [Acinetobacter sp. WU_MDCI_Axc73]|nr:hypothetical protein [Acinetobacter sp. WU_MDCI_Axc73]